MVDGVVEQHTQVDASAGAARTQRCQSCRFWAPSSVNEHDDTGLCRRYPPENIAVWNRDQKVPRSFWPKTLAAHWCGEWRAPAEERL